jgi:hypothetical protein
MRRLLKTPGRFCDMVVLFSGHLGSTVACLDCKTEFGNKGGEGFRTNSSRLLQFHTVLVASECPKHRPEIEDRKMRFEVESARSVGGSLGSR